MEVEERFRRHDFSRATGGGEADSGSTARDSADGRTRTASGHGTDERADGGCADRIGGGVATFAVRVGGKGIGRDGVVLPAKGERGHLERKAGFAAHRTGLLDADNIALDGRSARNDQVLAFKDVLRQGGVGVFPAPQLVAIKRLGDADAEEASGPDGDGGGGEVRRYVRAVCLGYCPG